MWGWFERIKNMSLVEYLLVFIIFQLLIITSSLDKAAKQRYAIAKMVSRGEEFD